ncbi:MAG: hypothetical protein JWM68_1469 [Verrucomicrobiales bacterium]|nr:hypothetical protein [Verrucomicrobiales bacterium]
MDQQKDSEKQLRKRLQKTSFLISLVRGTNDNQMSDSDVALQKRSHILSMAKVYGEESMSDVRNDPRGKHEFSTTQWSVVMAAAQVDPQKAHAALGKLCSRYWYPVYAFTRQKGYGLHESEDLTQGFFHFVLARQAFQSVDPQKGRFRSFLLAALSNFLNDERDKQQTWKRGGRQTFVSLDEERPEEAYRREPVDSATPEKYFERSWAAMLVRRVLDQLRQEYESRGKVAVFAGLQPLLTDDSAGGDYDRLAKQLGMEVGAIKVSLHRMRRRFGELLRREVAHTVSRPEEVEEEIRQLLAAIAG